MKTTASILILFCIAAAAFADTAEIDAQYFHPAASLYIQGDSAGASNLVAQGLSTYPDDGKLKRLKELLDQQQEQEQQDQKDQQDQQQDEQQDQDNQQQEQQDQESDQNQQDGQEPQDSQPEPQQPEPQSAEQMTPDEAQQLMDAMRQEEQNKRLQLHPVMGAPVKVDKDW
jgi:hypothetical protein